MSVTSSTDPVQTIVDILDAAAAGEWSHASGVPDRIERSEVSEPSEKLHDQRRTQVSLYVWSPVEGQREKWSAEGEADQTEGVRVDILHHDSATVNTYAGDVIDICEDYTNDNQNQTAWVDIWPDGVDDQTQEAFYSSAFAAVSVLIELRNHDDGATA